MNKVLRIEGVSAHYSMNEFSAIPNKVAERERHLKLRQSAKLAGVIDFDSDMSTDDEEGENAELADGGKGCPSKADYDSTGNLELSLRPYNDDGTFNLSYLAYLSRHRHTHGHMLSNMCVTTKIRVNYQRRSQVFGPLRIHTQVEGLDLQVDDAQMAFISHFAIVLDTHVYDLKQKCLRNFLFCTDSGLRKLSKDGEKVEDKQRRAQLRWKLIRQSVRRDWTKYTGTLKEGTLRWRGWFNEWRMCARYVALRELLIFHVGFEVDKKNGLRNYKLSESLLMDHDIVDVDDEGVECVKEGKKRKSGLRPYRGVGSMSKGVVQAAETLVQAKMLGDKILDTTNDVNERRSCESTVVAAGESEDLSERNENSDVTMKEICDPGSTASLALSSRTVRALYALQLELDCTLSVAQVAYCRTKADNRFRAARDKKKKKRPRCGKN